MSRSNYSDDWGDDNPGLLAMYRGQVASATRGKRGQALLKDILIAMNGMPVKRLITQELEQEGAVCAIGAAGKLRGVDMSGLDPEDVESVASRFNVADCLAREIVYENDECDMTREFEWTDGKRRWRRETPEERFDRMRKWVRAQIKDPLFDVVWC